VSVIFYQVEVSATGWSSVQRSFTECDGGTSTKNRPSTRNFDPWKKSTSRVYEVALWW